MSKHQNDRLPVWKIAKNIGTSQKEVIGLLREAAFPLTLDYDTGRIYTSEAMFREVVTDALSRLALPGGAV